MVASLLPLHHKHTPVASPEIEILLQQVSFIIFASSKVLLCHALQTIFYSTNYTGSWLNICHDVACAMLVRTKFLVLVSAHLMKN